MVAGKTQVAAVVAAVALAGSSYAAPAMEPQPLVGRADKIIKAAGKLAGDYVQTTVSNTVHDAVENRLTPQSQPLSQQQHVAVSALTGPHSHAAVSAALGHLPNTQGHGKRDFDDALAARADKVVKGGAKLLGDYVQTTFTNDAYDALKNKVGPKTQPLSSSSHAAVSSMTGPHSSSAVNAALGHLPKTSGNHNNGHGKRDLLELLAARRPAPEETHMYRPQSYGHRHGMRSFEDEVEEALAARADKVVKGGAKLLRDYVHTTFTNDAYDAVKNKFGAQTQPLSSSSHAAVSSMTGPHSSSAVNAALGHLPKTRGKSGNGHGKHDFDDFLVARADKIVKGGAKLLGDYVHTTFTNDAYDAVKNKFGAQTQPLSSSSHAAVSSMTGPHHSSAVNAALGHLPKTSGSGKNNGHGKRDLLDLLAARRPAPEETYTYRPQSYGHRHGMRSFEDEVEESLAARGDKVAKGGANILKDYVTTKLTNDAYNAANNQFGHQTQPLSSSAHAAVSSMTGPHHPSAVNAALGHVPKTSGGGNSSGSKGGNTKGKRNFEELLAARKFHPAPSDTYRPQSYGHRNGMRSLEDEIYEILARGYGFELDELE